MHNESNVEGIGWLFPGGYMSLYTKLEEFNTKCA
jgi:hypothetical protein